MNTQVFPPEVSQLPLILMDPVCSQETCRQHRHKVAETVARIQRLHDELNTQLYAHPSERPGIHSPGDAVRLLDCFIGSLDQEELWVVNLDTRNRILHLTQLYRGSVNSSQVRVAEVFRQAIIDNAPAIILAHNHPSGDTSPSPEDVVLTRAVANAGKLLDIQLLDHLIVAQGGYTSLKERSLGFE